MKANKFVVKGLEDASRIQDIERSIMKNEGINGVRVDMFAGTVTVDYDEARYTENDIKGFVDNTGLNVTNVK